MQISESMKIETDASVHVSNCEFLSASQHKSVILRMTNVAQDIFL